MPVLIQARGLVKKYSESIVLKSVNLDIQKGEFVSIMGPSGSGKSTLLHILSSLDSVDEGEVLFENKNPHQMTDQQLSRFRRHQLGFIFQFFNLLPHLTALENVITPGLLDGQSMQKAKVRGEQLLAQVGLQEKINHRPSQLSGGQMQRVAIARALFLKPAVIMADEPTGNLDSKSGREILDILQGLNQLGQTILMVTHDQSLSKIASRVIRLKDGQIESDVSNESVRQT